MPRLLLSLCLVLLVGPVACVDRPTSSAGQVFTGPVNLKLHQDYDPKSRVVAEVHHGDKLDIVGQRRRLYKLRTAKGVEGWTDERNLMSTEQMRALHQLEQRAGKMPSEGVATSYEALNVHTEPQRFSPSFFQIQPGEKFDVLTRQSAPRVEPKRRVLVKPQPRPEGSKKHADKKRLPPPPAPHAPALPHNWQELSQQRAPKIDPKAKKPEDDEEPPEPAPEDDWTLVRTPAQAAGWVLTSRLYLAIPDEVAQYAEGHRITTYFSLGKIHDDDRNEDKDTWLWTTVHAGEHSFDYDSFRVFTWNPRRHRYETAYIARTVEGYLPVLVNKTPSGAAFSVCLGQDDGSRIRREFVLVDRRVQPSGAEPCRPQDAFQVSSGGLPQQAPPTAPGKQSLAEKLKEHASELKKRLFGR